MNMITNDSYLQDICSCLGSISSAAQFRLSPVMPGGRRTRVGMKSCVSPMPVVVAITFTICIFAMRGWSDRSVAFDTTPWLQKATSVQRPQPGPPPQAGLAAVSLNNGTEIKSRMRLEGHGELTIKNGTSFDAIVNLVEPHTRSVVRSFYVQSGKSFVEKNIAPGTYQVYFSTGKDWDSGSRSFHDDAIYGRFERQIDFFEKEDPLTGNMEFRGYSVTLQYVEGGDEACLPVDKQTFQQMMMDQPSATAKLE